VPLVIAIDRFPERLDLARSVGAITVDYSEGRKRIVTALKDLTGGMGPDPVSMPLASKHTPLNSRAIRPGQVALMLETDRPVVLAPAIQAYAKAVRCRSLGVYGGLLDKVPFGAAFGKASP